VKYNTINGHQFTYANLWNRQCEFSKRPMHKLIKCLTQMRVLNTSVFSRTNLRQKVSSVQHLCTAVQQYSHVITTVTCTAPVHSSTAVQPRDDDHHLYSTCAQQYSSKATR